MGVAMPPIQTILSSTNKHTSNIMTRKIEIQMNRAIQCATDWKSGNTRVEKTVDSSRVYLHGNLIAEIGDDWMQIFDGGWQSKTTKSRLNALLEEFGGPDDGIFQKAYQWFLCADGVTLPFESGTILR